MNYKPMIQVWHEWEAGVVHNQFELEIPLQIAKVVALVFLNKNLQLIHHFRADFRKFCGRQTDYVIPTKSYLHNSSVVMAVQR